MICDFPDGFFPYEGKRIKDFFEGLKADFSPDVVFTHQRGDLHQDHRISCELTWNTFRDHLILEYEVPKYDGDMSAPNTFVPLPERLSRRKIDHLMDHFASQRSSAGFAEDLFSACSGCAAWSATRRAPTPRRSSAARPYSRDRTHCRPTRGSGDGCEQRYRRRHMQEAARAGLACGRLARRPSDEASVSLQLDVTSFEQLEEAFGSFRGCGCSCTAPGRFSLSGRC